MNDCRLLEGANIRPEVQGSVLAAVTACSAAARLPLLPRVFFSECRLRNGQALAIAMKAAEGSTKPTWQVRQGADIDDG